MQAGRVRGCGVWAPPGTGHTLAGAVLGRAVPWRCGGVVVLSTLVLVEQCGWWCSPATHTVSVWHNAFQQWVDSIVGLVTR